MAADVQEPESPFDVSACPHVRLPPLGVEVVLWPWGMSPNLKAWALAALRYPLGTIIRDVVDGKPVIAQITCHDRYGDDPSRPPVWHKGTTCYALGERVAGRLVAMQEPPAGWPGT